MGIFQHEHENNFNSYVGENKENITNLTRVIESILVQMDILELKSAVANMKKLTDNLAD